LGLRREFADRHVFDHAPAQRGLVGHGDAQFKLDDEQRKRLAAREEE
jgi:hypothetical protein